MSDLRVSRLWCLNDQAVPLVEAVVDVEDLEHLLPGGDQENMSVLLLNLKAGAGHWIEKALQLPNKFWNSQFLRFAVPQGDQGGHSEGQAKQSLVALLTGPGPEDPRSSFDGHE